MHAHEPAARNRLDQRDAIADVGAFALGDRLPFRADADVPGAHHARRHAEQLQKSFNRSVISRLSLLSDPRRGHGAAVLTAVAGVEHHNGQTAADRSRLLRRARPFIDPSRADDRQADDQIKCKYLFMLHQPRNSL